MCPDYSFVNLHDPAMIICDFCKKEFRHISDKARIRLYLQRSAKDAESFPVADACDQCIHGITTKIAHKITEDEVRATD